MIEQIYAWFLLPGFLITWIRGGAGLFAEKCNLDKTYKLWKLKEGNVNLLRLKFSPVRSLLFKFKRKPVYDIRRNLPETVISLTIAGAGDIPQSR